MGLQGFRALDSLGVEALTGFITAYFNTRDIAPLVASAALTATLGAGFTAQLGAMRISEEVDALEVMAVPSVPFLVTTRVIAGVIAIIPMYTIGLLASFASARLNVTLLNGLPGGTYDHYFDLFLPVSDILYSYLKVIVVRAGDHPDPLPLRLQRQGRPRGRRRGGGPRGAAVDRRRGGHGLLPHARDLRDGHVGAGGGMTRKALMGLAFVGVLVLLGGLAVGKYAGAFRVRVPVTLRSTGSAPSSTRRPTSRCAA